MIILVIISSSAVLVAIVNGIFQTINNKITTKNKELQKENEELKARINELEQTVSEHEATINDLRVSQEAHNINKQTDTAYSEYISW